VYLQDEQSDDDRKGRVAQPFEAARLWKIRHALITGDRRCFVFF
jgi:hypothetical protein